MDKSEGGERGEGEGVRQGRVVWKGMEGGGYGKR